MDTANSLVSLPTETLLYILYFLDVQSITRFSTTSRGYHNLCNEDPYLQSLVQLDMCGAEACLGPPNFGPRERLSYMMSRESSWFQISNPPIFIHRMAPGPHTSFSDVDEGVFMYGLESFPQDGDIAVEDELCKVIGALHFSHSAGDNSWTDFMISDNLNESIARACLALHEHDLIAIFTIPPKTSQTVNTVVSLRVYLLQFSTGNPHPSALSPVIDILQFERDRVDPEDISATISGRNLFVHCPCDSPNNSVESNFLVFDWETGDCLFSLIEPDCIGQFTLLPGDIIAMSNRSEGYLRFGRLRQSGSDAVWTMQWFNNLQLPQVCQMGYYNQISFLFHHKSNEPLPRGASTEPQLIFSPSKGLFTIILHMWDGRDYAFYLVTIHAESLMRCAGVFESSIDHTLGGEIRAVPWSEWGAKYSHFERMGGRWSQWDKRVDHFGQRQALLLPRFSDNELIIRDYNPLSVGYHQSHSSRNNIEVFVGERRCNRDAYFVDDILSCLPFVQTVGIPRPYSSGESLWMDQDHLITVAQNDPIEIFIGIYRPY